MTASTALPRLRLLLVPVVLALLGAITACQPTTGAPLSITDAYAKAMPAGQMTAIFGRIQNTTGQDVTVVSATTEVAASTELHEMVMDGGRMVMRPRAGGFVVPANGTLDLSPGGLHVMLIGLKQDLVAGQQVTTTLTLSDGSTVVFTATVRDMANAQESYEPTAGHSTHG